MKFRVKPKFPSWLRKPCISGFLPSRDLVSRPLALAFLKGAPEPCVPPALCLVLLPPSWLAPPHQSHLASHVASSGAFPYWVCGGAPLRHMAPCYVEVPSGLCPVGCPVPGRPLTTYWVSDPGWLNGWVLLSRSLASLSARYWMGSRDLGLSRWGVKRWLDLNSQELGSIPTTVTYQLFNYTALSFSFFINKMELMNFPYS